MKKLLALATLALGATWASAALPCGAPFGDIAADPHQDIIVAHKGDVETYVFQPVFCGKAKDFGLILPVPSMLIAEPSLSEAAAFDHLVKISAPIERYETQCMSRGGVGVGGDSDAASFGSDGTAVVASGHVGFLDWVQLKADSESAFTTWLDANGYPHDPSADVAFKHYVDMKWYFVAFKVAQEAKELAGGCTALGPVKLSFSTPLPVVPSRMASAGKSSSGMFSWRIFGITAADKQIDLATPSYLRKLTYSGAINAADVAALGGLASEGDRLTRLTATFYATETDDVALIRVAPTDFRDTITHVTYVPCGDNPVDPMPTDPGSPGATGSKVSGGCSTNGGSGGLFGAFVGLAALVALSRRRR
jgi:uncharacterized protein (TIGR03382 family)